MGRRTETCRHLRYPLCEYTGLGCEFLDNMAKCTESESVCPKCGYANKALGVKCWNCWLLKNRCVYRGIVLENGTRCTAPEGNGYCAYFSADTVNGKIHQCPLSFVTCPRCKRDKRPGKICMCERVWGK